MIQVRLTNDILKMISSIDENRYQVNHAAIPKITANRLRKNSKKKSSYASNKIEGSPLTEEQANAAIEADPHRHFLKPEQEVRNYFEALEFLEEQKNKEAGFSLELILKTQAIVEKGSSKEKIGLRGAMPPGYLFAVYDASTGNADYIPPEYSDIPDLLNELVEYVNQTDDHPLIIAAVVHYQLVTIHPFEDGNGRTARLMSGYILDKEGYGFQGIGSLEEYFAYDQDAYYKALQMDLPALYYSGRNNPPHSEIWINYFLHMVELYAAKVSEIAESEIKDVLHISLAHLKEKEKNFLRYLITENHYQFTPIEISKKTGISNRTIINRCAKLAENGFLIPNLVKERIRSYQISAFCKDNKEELIAILNNDL